MKFDRTPASLFEWAGRMTAVAIFLFWGAFFVDHLAEWFMQGGGRFPPPYVWIAQALHGVMVLAFAFLAFRPAPGAIAAVLATAAFFGCIHAFPWIAAFNFVPPALVGISILLKAAHGANSDIPAV